MSTVWKYKIEPGDNVISMPTGAVILSVQAVSIDEIAMWALVDDKKNMEERYFYITGTGKEIHRTIKEYIGTVQLYGGVYVQHMFEIHPPQAQ